MINQDNIKGHNTVCEAIKIVLKDKKKGMTSKQIYKAIIENNLYEFNAKNPQNVVTSTIRISCIGVDNKVSSRNKEFIIVSDDGNDIYYALNDNSVNESNIYVYTKENFLSDVFMSEKEYDKLTALLKRKKNIILQGAPGVGKTFCAKRLAWSVMGEKNNDRVCTVQFHQSYSYEDFIFGYRPTEKGGFEPRSGVFYDFCKKCRNDTNNKYFFIIDEINRGNLSKIFGELLMLIEADKRGEENSINLVYGGEAFYIPTNLYIIGLMNTADRSLAMIDYALRRRFSFYTMKPAFENAENNGFSDYTATVECDLYFRTIDKIKELNREIRKDTSLGKGFEIGHSYFAPNNTDVINDEWVCGVIEYDIIPLIEEYWFDDDKTADKWISEFRSLIAGE